MNRAARRAAARKARPAAPRVAPLAGTSCPDCGSTVTGYGGWSHAPTCPLFAALGRASDEDAAWFEANPGQETRTRPTTPAERSERELFGQPTDSEVCVAYVRRDGNRFTFLRRFEPSGLGDLIVTEVAK